MIYKLNTFRLSLHSNSYGQCLAVLGLCGTLGLTSIVEAQTPAASTTRQEMNLSALQATMSRAVAFPEWVILDDVKPQKLKTTYALSMPLYDTQIFLDKTSTVFNRHVYTATQAAMLTRVANHEIVYFPEYQKLAIHRIRILRGNEVIDKTTNATIKLLQQEQAMNSGIMTGAVNATILIDDIRVNDEVEICYSIQGDNPVFAGKYAATKNWDFVYAVGQKHLSINYPKDQFMQYRVSGPGDTNLVKQEKTEAGRKILRWSANQLAAIEFEAHVPLTVEQYRTLQFSQYRNWNDVARWADDLFVSKSSSPLLQQLVASLAKLENDEARVRKALEYVQNEIRYLSLSLGESSHRPAQPDEVLQRRFGDCKDKSLLLVSLLRQLNIEAYPVLINSSGHPALDKKLASPTLFDHAIVVVRLAGKEYYLDPTRTAQYGQLEQLGQTHHGASVLVVDGQSFALERVENNWRANSLSKRVETVSVDDWSKPVKFQVEQFYNGVQAELMRHYLGLQTKEQIRKMFATTVFKTYPHAEALREPVINDDRQANTLTISHSYSVRDFFTNYADHWTFKYSASNFRERFHPVISAQRRYPLRVERLPALMQYQLNLNLPEGFDANYQPRQSQISDSAFKASEVIRFSGRKLSVEVELAIANDSVDVAQLEAYTLATKNLSGFVEANLRLLKTDIKGSATRLLLDPSAKQKLTESSSAAVIRLTDEIAKNSDNSKAHCERGLAYASLRKLNDAKKDLNAVLGFKTTDSALIKCRVQLHFMLADFKSALADLQGLSELEPRLTEIRALSLAQSNRWREASQLYSQLYQKEVDEQTKQSYFLFAYFCAQKAGLKLPELSSFPGDGWLASLYAVLQGEKAEEQLFREIHQGPSTSVDAMLAQSYFMLGSLQTNRMNKMRARAYLQRALDKFPGDSLLLPLVRTEVEKPL